jgi:hypothetical protein
MGLEIQPTKIAGPARSRRSAIRSQNLAAAYRDHRFFQKCKPSSYFQVDVGQNFVFDERSVERNGKCRQQSNSFFDFKKAILLPFVSCFPQ